MVSSKGNSCSLPVTRWTSSTYALLVEKVLPVTLGIH